MRNRVAVDEMILNGVKPWIISKEDEQSHLTALNSLRMFQGCHKPLIINGKSEHVVMEQIQNALKIITERMEQKSQKEKVDEASHEKDASKSENSGQNASKKSNQRSNQNDTKKGKSTQNRDNDFRKKEKEEEREENLKNVVFFTGKALVEIMRD
jgi:type IV secretory pathway VirB10-like protein